MRVKVRFGNEIEFDDLIEEYETRHGKLWVYGSRKDGLEDHFKSSDLEKELYRKITMRIENHLESLTKKVVVEDNCNVADTNNLQDTGS